MVMRGQGEEKKDKGEDAGPVLGAPAAAVKEAGEPEGGVHGRFHATDEEPRAVREEQTGESEVEEAGKEDDHPCNDHEAG